MAENESKVGKAVEFVKDHVKVVVTIVVLGFTLTLGWAKGCTVNVEKAPADPVVEVAPAAP